MFVYMAWSIYRPVLVWQALVLGLLLAASPLDAGEREFAQNWCRKHGGVVEVVLEDRTRVDCLTDTHAIEVEYGPKWAEAIGQALHYALMTGKRAGVVIILRDKNDERYARRIRNVAREWGLDIAIWREYSRL
jgi:hypothetical protein